jgi:hypothetical protein
VFYSDYNHTGAGDYKNTGWALFQATSPIILNSGHATLSVNVAQNDQDGIGFTLGYVAGGLLKICKVAGPGIAVGTPFNFTTVSNAVTTPVGPVPAGPPPGGYCVLGPSFPPGSTVTVAENPPANTVSNIVVAPPGTSTVNVAGGNANVVIGNGITEVTFTNKNSGFLEICKTAGSTRGNYAFTISPGPPGPYPVPVGACSSAIEVPATAAGQPIVITEQHVAGGIQQASVIVKCNTIPAANQQGCSATTSTVTVFPGDVSAATIALITNGPPTVTGSGHLPPAKH